MLYRVRLYKRLENRVLSLKCALVKKATRSCSCKTEYWVFLKKCSFNLRETPNQTDS